MAQLEISAIPLLQDNYAWLLRDGASGQTAVVDPSEAAPVAALLGRQGLQLNYVLNTHHHHDHTGGNSGLKSRYGCEVVAPLYDAHRISSMDIGLGEDDTFMLGTQLAHILYIPGHTLGHIAFWFHEAQALFCGDTLFSLGCGRMFEGTPEQMAASLAKLAALPPTARVFCGHEYTAANARFAASIEPDNQAVRTRAAQVAQLRQAGTPTVPSLLGDELACNPFLRLQEPAVRRAVGMDAAAPASAVFAALRKAKDDFK